MNDLLYSELADLYQERFGESFPIAEFQPDAWIPTMQIALSQNRRAGTGYSPTDEL